MIKKTLYFGNPIYLSLRNAQLVLRTPEVDKGKTLEESFKQDAERTIPSLDVMLEGKRSPLMIAVGQTTASLVKCFNGELRKIAYPEL